MNKKKNVLLISTDHWKASLLGAAGHPQIITPTLNSMARDGVRFTNAYSECPVCIPARRGLMTGLTPRTHGDRVYTDTMRMPDVPTLAQTFRDNGYQAYAVGKLHVYPQRNRIGFDDAQIIEEGRYEFGVVDDYQRWLGEQGFVGKEFAHGMGNNTYETRTWHLPEYTHPTNWVTDQMINTIKRQDPDKPGFYYLSYPAPHPPLVPLAYYWDLYKNMEIPDAVIGDWVNEAPAPIQALTSKYKQYSIEERKNAIRAFYALCTHVDHQIRLVIGTLREMSLLDDTIILFLSDHGDMLFDHNMLAKRVMYEGSANIPLILSGKPIEHLKGTIDDRLICLADIMPSLLDLCDLEIPDHVEGISFIGDRKRKHLYGEIGEGLTASRMIHNGHYKLIYYPVGNYKQIFDLQKDPNETTNLSGSLEISDIEKELTGQLIAELYKEDVNWVQDGVLVGLNDSVFEHKADYSLYNQRGGHWPPPSGYSQLGKNL